MVFKKKFKSQNYFFSLFIFLSLCVYKFQVQLKIYSFQTMMTCRATSSCAEYSLFAVFLRLHSNNLLRIVIVSTFCLLDCHLLLLLLLLQQNEHKVFFQKIVKCIYLLDGRNVPCVWSEGKQELIMHRFFVFRFRKNQKQQTFVCEF